jgi:hypothetical protein
VCRSWTEAGGKEREERREDKKEREREREVHVYLTPHSDKKKRLSLSKI